jgi:hypothetical protein
VQRPLITTDAGVRRADGLIAELGRGLAATIGRYCPAGGAQSGG